MVTSPSLQYNALLAALPGPVQERLAPDVKVVDLPLGKVLYESGNKLHHAYFPIESIISVLCVVPSGATAEISMVGNEGMIGVALFMGGESTPSRAIVQRAGHAFQLPGQALVAEFTQHEELRKALLRYTLALIAQTAQIAACNRHHSVDQRLCRWLLSALDRLPDNRLVVTQELIATMLGVRREGVTEAACKLQRLGVIDYHRGHITVIDRARLERLSCECYAAVKKETARLVRQRNYSVPGQQEAPPKQRFPSTAGLVNHQSVWSPAI